jgi:prepilin peptidase CpaA
MTITAIINHASLLSAFVLLALAAVSDARSFKIPNFIPAGLILGFVVYAATAATTPPLLGTLVVFAITLGVGFLLFIGNIMGAGDGKFLAALSLWVGAAGLPELLLATVFLGGVLAFVVVGIVLVRNTVRKRAGSLRKTRLPYVIAIAGAGFYVLWPQVLTLKSVLIG